MKKCILLYAILLFFSNKGFAQPANTRNQFILNGNLTGTHVDSVILYCPDSSGKYMHIEKPVVNNTFSLSGSVNHPVQGTITFKITGEIIAPNQRGSRMKSIYIEPGTMILRGDPLDMKSLKISGSKSQLESDELDSRVAPIMEEMKPYAEAFQKEPDHEKKAVLHDQLEPFQNRIKQVSYQFFLDHPNSYVTANMIGYYVSRMSLDSAKAIYNGFNEQLRETVAAKELAAKIESIKQGMTGSMAHAFTKTDINGKLLSLADFRGKYVMLDFWASWCVPCRKGNPHMIEVYNKYKDKGFEVIGVADDDHKTDAWNAAVTKDGVSIWHQVLRGLKTEMIMKHIPNPDDMDEIYGISTIPTKILIDPTGKIIGRFGDSLGGGDDDDMDKMLASIFNK